jgi:hypothetical protein
MPAGLISAFLSPTGLLTITGDAHANGVTLKVTAGDVTLTPDADTTISSGAPGVPLTLPGVVKSIKADLKGSDDTLLIDNTVDFVVTGPVAITLGDGNNTLNLTTAGKITLGALTVKGADGTDTVTIQGGAGTGSTIGPASFNYANGGSTTTLGDVRFNVGVTLIAGDAVTAPNAVTATNVTVVKTFSAALANSNPALVSFTGSTLGGLKETGFVVGALLQSTNVLGSINIKGGFQADLQTDTVTVSGSVALTAPAPSFTAAGDGTTINGNLLLTGTAWTATSFQSATLSQVKGSVTVTGGWYNDTFESNGLFRVDKNLSLTLNGGDNVVNLTDASVGWNLKIRTGAGNDQITLDRTTVALATSIFAFAGADTLSIENGSTFATTFGADLGTGNDTVSVAQNPAASGAVTFVGAARILAGAGNDTLLLGLDPGFGGSTNSRAVFVVPTSLVDGGDGIDNFDNSTAQFTGVTPIGWNV